MTNNEFDVEYTTRAGGYFSGNSLLTHHIIHRKTKRSLCGRDTQRKAYRWSGWTSQFDHQRFQFEDDEFGRGDCQRCAKIGRNLGFTDTVFRPQKTCLLHAVGAGPLTPPTV